MNEAYHIPVLLRESVEALQIKPDGIYVDVTFGGGGHSRTILEQLTTGRLLAFDQDADALPNAQKIEHQGFTLISANFRYLQKYLKLYGVTKVDGILADLGVSSHQFDTAQRGFSIRYEGPLDMRMNQDADRTAEDVLNTYTEEALHKIFGMYGELRNARTLAKTIVNKRTIQRISTIDDLKNHVLALAPRNQHFKYLAQVFQALRIEVNQELSALEDLLVQSAEVLQAGGRLVAISYHSLEDRLVKRFIANGKFVGDPERDFYGNILKPFKAVNKKPIIPSQEEQQQNTRSRSAKMRIAVALGKEE